MRESVLVACLALSIALGGCAAQDDDDVTEFNALPRVDAEIGEDADLDAVADLTVTLVDEDGEVCSLAVDVSFDGGASYAPASVTSDEVDLDAVACTRVGERFTLAWDAAADWSEEPAAQALLRFQASDPEEPGPPFHLEVEGASGTPIAYGQFEARPGAPLPQWQYQRLGLARVLVDGTDVAVVGPPEYLAGADKTDAGEDGVMEWTFELPDAAPGGHVATLSLGEERPGSGALYLPFVWKDDQPQSEPEPTFDDGEPLVGVGHGALLGYIEPLGDWTTRGWHVVALTDDDAGGAAFDVIDLDTELHVLLKGYAVDDLDNHPLEVPVVGAAMIPTDPMHRCGLMPRPPDPVVPNAGVEVASTPFDSEVTALTFQLHADELPDSHWDGDGFGFFADEVAREEFFLYVDADVSGDATPGEHITHYGMAVDDEKALMLLYLRGAMQYPTLWDWARDTCWSGFNLVTDDDDDATVLPTWTCYSTAAPPEMSFEHAP